MNPVLIFCLIIYGTLAISIPLTYIVTTLDLTPRQLFVSLFWPLEALEALRYLYRGAKDWWRDVDD